MLTIILVSTPVPSRRFHQTLPNLGLILGLSSVSKYVGRIEATHPKLGRVTRPNSSVS